MLEAVKLALRITDDEYDGELQLLIDAAIEDLGIAGVQKPCVPTALVKRAVVTYCRLHFGDLEASMFDKLKASYDEQKSQLSTSSLYNGRG